MKSTAVISSTVQSYTQYNDLRLDATLSSYLSVTANTPVSANVTLQWGNFQNSSWTVITITNTSVTWITFPSTPTHKWYILISLDDSGTVVKTVWTSAVSPTKPAIPSNNFPCGYLLLSQWQTTVAQTDISDAKIIWSTVVTNFTWGNLVYTTTTQTLTNKTLTSPVINTPTWIVKWDVWLWNVDNTSDSTKNSATATLTNKTLTAPVISTITNTWTLTLPTTTDTLVWKTTTDTLTNKTLTAPIISSIVNTWTLTLPTTTWTLALVSQITGTQAVNTPAWNIASTTVQWAINELDTEKLALSWWTLTWVLLEAQSITLWSAATVNLATATWNSVFVMVSWATTITSFWTVQSGASFRLTFEAGLTITHNATSLILPWSANITTANNDSMIIQSIWSWNWRCICYQKADWKALVASLWAPKEIRIRIPWELVADTTSYQWVFWKNNTWATITISNVSFQVALAASWGWAAAAFNIYKSNGTATNGINTSAVNLFTSAVDLTTNYESLTNVPNTTTVEIWRWVSLRVTSSAWATTKASDAEVIISYS